MKVTYWYAPHLSDSQRYAIRTRTKREALDFIASWDENGRLYGHPRKVTLGYDNAFDLIQLISGESGNPEERLAEYDQKANCKCLGCKR